MRIEAMKKLLTALLFAPLLAFASGAELHLDKAPVSTEPAALQNGAKLFVNYCLNCHGASYMRYNRLQQIGLSEQMIKDNLMFTADKVGEPMRIAMQRDEAKEWFGAAPPDLTVVARSRASEFGSGADWLYTYLRGFYRDSERPTGWNNVIKEIHLEQGKPGKMSKDEYDKATADLVSYLVWMGEPMAETRKTIGTFVIAFLGLLFVLSYLLKKNYWKDIH